ncbi:MAG: hypothetical protein AAB074_12965 [Planctomycetota bacterium]
MVGSAAKKLLDQMRATSAGWSEQDFSRLFLGYGFDKKGGGGHTKYSHPRYPALLITVPRHRKLKNWVAREAVKLIEKLEALGG